MFRIRNKSFIDRDSEYLLQENEPDGTLDQKLLEDLQKKKMTFGILKCSISEKSCLHMECKRNW